MRVAFCSLLFLLISSSCEQSKPVTITSKEIVEPLAQSTGPLQLSIAQASSSGAAVVRITNASEKPLRMWKDSNSWGAARWRILLIRKGQLHTFFQNPDHDFTRNIPSFNEIAPGASIEQKLNLNDGDWRGIDSGKVQFTSGDYLIVLYDVPFTPEALNSNVWYGVASAITTVNAKI
jgi:hypothetical protein